MMKYTSSFPAAHRFLSVMLNVLLAVVLCAPFTLASAASTDVDLKISLRSPMAGNAGGDFETTYVVDNLPGRATAQNAQVTFTFDEGTKDLAVECDSATGGALCPTTIAVEATRASAVITVPSGASLTFKARGKTPSKTSTTFSAEVQPEAGVTDTDPTSNQASQNMTLNNNAEIEVTKTQDKEVVVSDETRTYTVTFENKGEAGFTAAKVSDIFTYKSVDGVSIFNANWHVVTTCTAEGDAVCPQNQDWTFSSRTYSGNADLFHGNNVLKLPAHSKLIFTIAVTVTLDCTANGVDISVENTAQFDGQPGIGATGNNKQSVKGTIKSPGRCPVYGTVGKTQDKEVIDNGQTRIYTVTYTNPTDSPITGKIRDRFVNLTVKGSGTYTVTCQALGGSVCPSFADGSAHAINNLGGMQTKELFSADNVTLPAQSSLIFTVAMTMDFQCAVYRENRVENNASLTVNGQESRAQVQGKVNIALCPVAQSSTQITQDKETVGNGDEIHYRITYSNDSDLDIPSATLRDIILSQDAGDFTAHYTIKCVTEETTAPCPKNGNINFENFEVDYPVLGTPGKLYQRNVALLTGVNFPARTKIVLDVTQKLTYACTGGGVYRIKRTAEMSGSGLVTVGRSVADVSARVLCNDVTTQTQVSNHNPQPLGDMTLTSTITNSLGRAENFTFTVQTPYSPTRSFIAASDTVPTCEVTRGSGGETVCPADLKWNVDDGTITGTIPVMTADTQITIMLKGTAGVVPPITQSASVTTETSDVAGDTQPSSNNSADTFGYVNTQTAVKVIQRVTGLPPTGAPQDLVFTGELTCAVQGNMPFTVTVPQGGTDGTLLVADNLWKQDNCTMTIAEPSAPAGFYWKDWETETNQSRVLHENPETFVFSIPIAPRITTIQIPETPQLDDPCGLDNAQWVKPEDTREIHWTIREADKHLIATAQYGFEFPDGSTVHDFGVAHDSGQECPVPEPEPTPEPEPEPEPEPTPEPEPSVKRIKIPAKPSVDDPCGLGNAQWIKPKNTAQVIWNLSSRGHLVVVARSGYKFPDGSTVHDFGVAHDSGQECPVPEPEPTPEPEPNPTPEPEPTPGPPADSAENQESEDPTRSHDSSTPSVANIEEKGTSDPIYAPSSSHESSPRQLAKTGASISILVLFTVMIALVGGSMRMRKRLK